MSQSHRVMLDSVLVGDELGQLKLVNLANHQANYKSSSLKSLYLDSSLQSDDDEYDDTCQSNRISIQHSQSRCHEIVRLVDGYTQNEPAAARAIISIRPIHRVNDSFIDNTDKPNNLFLVANKLGQVFVCNTSTNQVLNNNQEEFLFNKPQNQSIKALTPIYYNMSNKVQISGAQPLNQTNILIIYKNGDIQHVDISQDVLQSALQIKRKAISLLGLKYSSDARKMNWKIEGSTGKVVYGCRSSQVEGNDQLTNFNANNKTVLPYNQSPCKIAQKFNKSDRLIPTQVINMISSHDNYKSLCRVNKWNSVTSLNMICTKLALYDLISTTNMDHCLDKKRTKSELNCFKMNDNRLAVGGQKYTVRIYDLSTQKAIYNCRFGTKKNPLPRNSKENSDYISDIEWLGGNKTTKSIPNMIAICSGLDAIIKVFDLKSPKPVFNIDLTHETETCWQPYDGHPKGCQFTSISTTGAPHSTAIPSQQCAVGSKNGQLHIIDLRFPSRSYRRIGRLNGFCGGEIRQIRFVSESLEKTKMVTCSSDRFVRIHSFHTSFTSLISQKLTSQVFMSTRPTCVQPVCREIGSSISRLD